MTITRMARVLTDAAARRALATAGHEPASTCSLGPHVDDVTHDHEGPQRKAVRFQAVTVGEAFGSTMQDLGFLLSVKSEVITNSKALANDVADDLRRWDFSVTAVLVTEDLGAPAAG